MHNLYSPIYRTVAVLKAMLILAAGVAPAVEYLKQHGFSEIEATSLLKGK